MRLSIRTIRLLAIPIMFLACFSCAGMTQQPGYKIPSPEEIGQSCNPKLDLPEFGNEFSCIFTNLIAHSWCENGDWQGDLQGDAAFFGPVILYALWKDTGTPAYRYMADRTVEREISLVRRFYFFPVPNMDMAVGFPALAEAYKATGNEKCLSIYVSGVKTGSMLASFCPGIFTPFVYDKASVYGTVSTMSLQAYELTGDESFKIRGLALIAAADRTCWKGNEGVYAYEKLADWSQATMMITLVKAYRITGDHAYLDRCFRLITSMDDRYWDKQKGGYFNHDSPTMKSLSGNNTFAWAFLDLYEATGKRIYLDKTREILGWIFSDDLYDRKSCIIHHDWDAKSGRADMCCTGCNFHTLCIIYRLNKLSISPPPSIR